MARWWMTGAVLVVVGVASAAWAGQQLEGQLAQLFAGLPEQWHHQQRSLEELAGQLTAAQLQLERWARSEEAGGVPGEPGVVVLPREQLAQMAGQLRSAVSQMESLQRLSSQAAQATARLAEPPHGSLVQVAWASLGALVAAQLVAGVWLGRKSLRPVGQLRRERELAEEGLRVLVGALPRWFMWAAAHLHQLVQRAEAHRSGLDGLQVRLEGVVSATVRVQEQSKALGRSADQFSAVAERVRELGSESRWLSLSTALEAARVEPHARALMVVAEEIRRLGGESRQMVSELSRLQRELVQQADQASGASQVAAHAIRRVQEELEGATRASRELVAELERLHERLVAAGRAATGAAGEVELRAIQELRLSVEKALAEAASPVEVALRQTAAASQGMGNGAREAPEARAGGREG